MARSHPALGGAEPSRDQERFPAGCCLAALLSIAFWIALGLAVGAFGGCASTTRASLDVAPVWSGTPPADERAATEDAARFFAARFRDDNGSLPRVSRLELLWGVDRLPWSAEGWTGQAWWPEGRIAVVASDVATLYHELGHLLLAEQTGDGDAEHERPEWRHWARRQQQHAALWAWTPEGGAP